MKRYLPYCILVFCFFIISSTYAKADKESIFIENLISKMTFDEKIGQMIQLQGAYNSAEKSRIEKGAVGSYLLFDSDSMNVYQRIAVEKSRLKIPLVFALDVIHGYKTIFPIPLGMAATFNPSLMKDASRIAATEATADGIRWTFAPMVDVSRDSRWGRIAESFGEDPVLSANMGVASVLGFQGKDLTDQSSLAACAKHFVGYGAVEGGKDYNSTNIPDRLMRNVYLYPFEQVVKNGVASLMTSFNDNDGVPMTGNSYYTKKILRNEWKFDGVLISDWEAIQEMISHGFATDGEEAATKAIKAGVDIEMVSNNYVSYAKTLIAEGKIKIEDIDHAVRNILRMKYRLGLFEKPYYDDKKQKPFYNPEYLEKAKEAALQSVVLLKNNKNVLPISATVKKIAVIGPMADAPAEQLGTWVLKGDTDCTRTPWKVIKEQYGNRIQLSYEPVLSNGRSKNKNNFDKALALAKNSDMVLLFLGEEAFLSGEGHSLADIRLLGAQKELVALLKNSGKPLVTIIMAGRALTIKDELDNSDALLYAWHPGTMGGDALADILFGKESPSGKLPITIPYNSGQLPIYYNHHNTGRPAADPVMTLDHMTKSPKQTTIGYRAAYLDYGKDPLFSFGFGLSYTTFDYTNLKLSKKEIKPDEMVTVSCSIKNSGDRKGTEIVQLYLRDVSASVARPVLELKDFRRVFLLPGEVKQIIFNITPAMLSFYDIDMKRSVEPGVFEIKVAAASSDIRLEDKIIVRK